jgi:hypothetical protein
MAAIDAVLGSNLVGFAEMTGTRPDGPLSIGPGDDPEAVAYTGKTETSFTGCVRGWDGTRPRAHAAREPVELRPLPAHFAGRDSAILAIEQALGANLGNVASAADLAGKSNVGHLHDDRYYTEAEADARYALQSQLHAPVTVADSSSIDLTLTGQQVAAAAIFGGTAGTVAQGNDARLSDARTPTAHQAGHQSGGGDALSGLLDAIARITLRRAGTFVGSRRGLNLIAGSNVTIDVADDATNERVDVTIAAAAVGDVVRFVPLQVAIGTNASTTSTTVYSVWLQTTSVLDAGTWDVIVLFAGAYFASGSAGGPAVLVSQPITGGELAYVSVVSDRSPAVCFGRGQITSDGTAATSFQVAYRRNPAHSGTPNAEHATMLAICRKVG